MNFPGLAPDPAPARRALGSAITPRFSVPRLTVRQLNYCMREILYAYGANEVPKCTERAQMNPCPGINNRPILILILQTWEATLPV